MEPYPPQVTAITQGLRAELAAFARGPSDLALVEVAVTAATRMLLQLHEPAARDPNDRAWDIAHDRLLRRFLRCADAVRYPKRRPTQPTGPSSSPHTQARLAAAFQVARSSKPAAPPATTPPPNSEPKPTPAPSNQTAPAPLRKPNNPTQAQAQAQAQVEPSPNSVPRPEPAPDSPLESPPRRRPDPAKLLRQSRQERRRLARQRSATRASPPPL